VIIHVKDATTTTNVVLAEYAWAPEALDGFYPTERFRDYQAQFHST
jgi:hypothetical protein